jgi:hypothetical protein
MYDGDQYAVADAAGARLERCVGLFPRSERPTTPMPTQRARGR